MVLPLPMIKLGGLIVRTMTKPLAKAVKTRAKVHAPLATVCHWFGQQQHRLSFRFHLGHRGVTNFVIKDLPRDQAIELGADFIGELLIFSVAVAVASFEYQRSSLKSKEQEQIQLQLKQQAERETEERFARLEQQLHRLELHFQRLGLLVESDIEYRIEKQEGGGHVPLHRLALDAAQREIQLRDEEEEKKEKDDEHQEPILTRETLTKLVR